jgi:hypothetical protein
MAVVVQVMITTRKGRFLFSNYFASLCGGMMDDAWTDRRRGRCNTEICYLLIDDAVFPE